MHSPLRCQGRALKTNGMESDRVVTVEGMPGSSPAIEAVDLVKKFGADVAVNGVSFAVPQGTVLGLLGPNGAGKTTTVRMMTTLTEPTSGTARVAGYDVREQPDMVRRNMGLTGQVATVDELLTGRENIRMIGGLYGIRRSDLNRLCDQLLQQFSIADAADRPVKSYSGGMRRRLDLAVSLLAAPPVLFLDEPTTGLDPRSRNDLWDVLRELVREGTTLLLTTQYLEEADQLADNVGIIDSGRIVAEGTPAALKAELGHPHIRLQLEEGSIAEAEEICARIGPLLPPIDGRTLLVEVEHGAGDIPRVVRALDEAGIEVGSLELVHPSLDDVFVARTGYHLESDSESDEEPVAQ